MTTAKVYKFHGEFLTMQEIADLEGRDYNCIRRRRRGEFIPDNEDIDRWRRWRMTHRSPTAIYVEFDGQRLSLMAWAKEFRVPYPTLMDWWKKEHLTIEQIAARAKMHDRRHIEFEGRNQTLKAWAAELGISYATAQSWRGKGMSIEEIATKARTDYKPCPECRRSK